MDTLLIVDGHNLLFQMFYGMPSRIINKNGKAIHGVLGFVGALIKTIKVVDPTHAAVLFDGEHENDRAHMLPEYKANRENYSTVSDDENPFSQLSGIYDSLGYMKIKHCEVSEHEADDVIAGYALTYGKMMRIIIVSHDRDFFQLINDNVSVLRYRGDKSVLCDASYILQKYGIPPGQHAEFKSLTGDSSDNIQGAGGIGIKTAASLLNQFGGLKEIILEADKIRKVSVKKSVTNNANRLMMNYDLIKLNSEVTLPFDMDDLSYRYDGMTTNEVLSGIGLK